jgi:integrase
MASIRKRADRSAKPWQAAWREYPGGPNKTKQFARRVDAEKFLDGIRGDLAHGTYVDPMAGHQTFASFADEWAVAQDWKATSRESWPYIRARLAPLLGDLPLASIDRLVLQRVRQALSAKYARSTTTVTMTYAGMIMRAAYASGRIGRDPTRGLRTPRARADEPDGRVGPNQVPTRAEALAILAAAPEPFRAAIALGMAGLRVGEVLGMTADRLELERRQVTVDRQLQRIGGQLTLTTPKAEKNRTIIVPGSVAFELRRHLRDHCAGDGVLFQGGRGAPMLRRDQFYDAAWRPALRAAGLAPDRFTFHALRHFCASTLLAEGAPVTAVAGHLGDTVETVSRVYAHWLRDDRDVPAEILDRVLAPPAVDQLSTTGHV